MKSWEIRLWRLRIAYIHPDPALDKYLNQHNLLFDQFEAALNAGDSDEMNRLVQQMKLIRSGYESTEGTAS